MSPSAGELRKALRDRRRQLAPADIDAASAAICATLLSLPAMHRASRIAAYVPAFGEVNCSDFALRMRSRRKRTYVPVLRKNRMLFAPWDETCKWDKNRFGIAEPVCRDADLLSARQLDVVVAPLVAFDTHLNRLGMGGGYYDRTFAFRKRSSALKRPSLIGVAYSFQRVAKLPVNDWDVPLDVVITEKECFGSY